MQDLSFDFRDPIFDFNDLRFGVQIFTYENVYGLDPASCTITHQENNSFSISCTSLSWAGGQEKSPGHFVLNATRHADKTVFELEATCSKTIRCVKLWLTGIESGSIVNLRETDAKTIDPGGLILRYPDGWRGLYTPLVVMQRPHSDQEFLYFRSLDTEVREKRFAFIPGPTGCKVELIFEETATRQSNRVRVPAWEVGISTSLAAILEEQDKFLQSAYKLVEWEERADVPGWAKEIALVAAIHCQHWSGHIFNDYDQVLQTLKYLSERIEPKRVLAYLPGWEGRYYWQYGDYRPDLRMGGEEGFARLCRGAKDLGIHLMPMFGMNVVNRGLENFEQWGAPALTSHAGGVVGSGSVDWDGSRHYDHAWGAVLNPGAPGWQNRLVGQIRQLVERYGFEGVFLDISAVWYNDPRYNTYEGVLKLVERIRQNHPELLIGGEGWYDGVGRATPLMQSGHTDGQLHWHDELAYPALFDKYNRSFAHLCLGDPATGSTGVHELGYNTPTEIPLRKSIWPTVTIVGDTLKFGREGLDNTIKSAQKYSELFLG